MKINLVNENFRENYLANLLATRGVYDIKEFINPSVFHLSNPRLFTNINAGCNLLDDITYNHQSKILIVVDSDVDGFTSGAIVYSYIKAIAPW
jgi:single-stranded DNA-specific DHH superfamily exonuclease